MQFRSKQCVFLGYSNLHKGFKCLDPNEGRVYISRDVVFDEHVFPFATLNPNAGARLHSELAVLPDVLQNPSSNFGDAILHDRHLSSPASTNSLPSFGIVGDDTGTNEAENCKETESSGRYFMCAASGDSTRPKTDSPGAPAPDSCGAGGSPSGLAR